MKFFTGVDDGFVLLKSRGVFKQAALYTRGEKLYAQWGSGFIDLLGYDNATTQPNVKWVELSVETKPSNASSGYLERA